MTTERWAPIDGYSFYEVSDEGRVRSFRNNRWGRSATPRVLSLREKVRPHALSVYHEVRLVGDDGRCKSRLVHQLVLAAFVGPCLDGLVVRHLNGVGTDNHLANLRYGTASENAHDTVAHGLNRWARRTHCPKGHPYSGDNLGQRRDHPGRSCRECERQRQQIRNARRKKAAA